ncbi:PREDICTED: nodal homolog [Gekko japonicus]|uniref:Nodal homolog n=1 Tax=Gekko japonicus TaxID=146911 RepID=A0ABM1KVS6_GEKJA|nr:PREDICTED: nodal homolog [Gekko japonicus]
MRPGSLLLLLLLAGLGSEAGAAGRDRRCAPPPALPAYMRSLYRAALLPRADVVRSLRPHSVHKVGQKWSIIFNFSVSQGEELQLAELRLYLSRPGRNFPSTSNPVWVDLFHQQDTSCQHGHNCPHIVHLGSFTVSPPFPSSWIVLEVTQQLSGWFTISSWVKEPFQNDPIKWNTKHSLKRVTSLCKSANKKAFLVLFSSFSEGEGESSRSTLLQTVKSSKYFIHRTSKDIMPHWGTKRHRRHKKPLNLSLPSSEEPEARGLCHRVDFHVDFDRIGWGSWIVYPKQYNAFRCEGNCPVPLDEGFQPTNSAYMQSLLKYFHPERVPASCCVPVRLRPLSLLYYEEGRLSIGHHEDMIVEECGCH